MRRSAWLLLLVAAMAPAQVPPGFEAAAARLAPVERSRLERQARAWAAMDAQARVALARRARAFDAATLAERRRRRADWAAWQALPPHEQARLRARAAEVARLEPAAQAALRARFNALDASEQRGWQLGPALGADYVRLHPLLAQVPREQHARLLRTLRAMSAFERGELATLAQRTPPADRDRLRRELLAVPPLRRGDWLYQRLQQ